MFNVQCSPMIELRYEQNYNRDDDETEIKTLTTKLIYTCCECATVKKMPAQPYDKSLEMVNLIKDFNSLDYLLQLSN